MQYKEKIIPAIFLRRPNRFIAIVSLEGTETVVHVKNTGRCRELLIPGCQVWLTESENPARKTKFDLVAVNKICSDGRAQMINMDSQFPNSAAEEWLRIGGIFSPEAEIRREVQYGKSRFDFQIIDGDRKCFMEVKGVTLEQDGIAMFPDAPTERGVKHLQELITAGKEGYETFVLFVIQMKSIREFRPNDNTHKAFGEMLRKAEKSGVKVLAYDCRVAPDSMFLDQPVKVNLE